MSSSMTRRGVLGALSAVVAAVPFGAAVPSAREVRIRETLASLRRMSEALGQLVRNIRRLDAALEMRKGGASIEEIDRALGTDLQGALARRGMRSACR